LGFEMGKELGQ
jgi:hypothetical protein